MQICVDAAHALFYRSHQPPSKETAESEWKGKKGQALITIKCNFLPDRKFLQTTLKSGNLHFQKSIHHLTFYAIIPECNIFNTLEHFPQITGNYSYLQFSPLNCSHCWSYHARFSYLPVWKIFSSIGDWSVKDRAYNYIIFHWKIVSFYLWWNTQKFNRLITKKSQAISSALQQ